MKIRDTSTVYGYAITLCMGSFVFGYQLSSFSNLSEGIAWYNNEDNPSNVAHLMTYFNILFGVSTLVGTSFAIQESFSTITLNSMDGYLPLKSRIC